MASKAQRAAYYTRTDVEPLETREQLARLKAEAAVVRAARTFALINRTFRANPKWWQKRDEAEAVLFARVARLERIEKGGKRGK